MQRIIVSAALPVILLVLSVAPARSQALTNTTWYLHSIEYGTGVRVVPPVPDAASLRLDTVLCDDGSGWYRGGVTGGCNTISAAYRLPAAGSIEISTGGGTLRNCEPELLDFDMVFAVAVRGQFRHALGAGFLRLWSADSLKILHFGTVPAPAPDAGVHVQIVDLADSAVVLSANNGGGIFVTPGTSAICPAIRFAAGVTRLSLARSGTPPFFSQMLPPGDTGRYVLYVYGGGGARGATLLRRAEPVAGSGIGLSRVINLSPGLGDATVRVDRHGRTGVYESSRLRPGEATPVVPTPKEYLRLRIARVGQAEAASFRPRQFVDSLDAWTCAITGIPDDSSLAVWFIRESPATAALMLRGGTDNVTRPGPESPWARAVNLSTRPLRVTTMNLPTTQVPSGGASAADVDQYRAPILLTGPEGDVAAHTVELGATTHVFTVIRHEVDGQVQDLSLTGPLSVPTDSAMLALSFDTRGMRVDVDGVARSIFEHRYIVPAGTVKLNVYRPLRGGADSAVASIDLSMRAGQAIAVLFSPSRTETRAWLLEELNPAPQGALAPLAIGPPSPAPETPVGRLVVAHATLDGSSMRVTLGTDVLSVEPSRARIRYPVDTTSDAGSVELNLGSGYRTMTPSYPIIGDTTTLLLAIGSSARPHRVLTVYSPAGIDPTTPGPYLRFVNALDDSITVDIAGLQGPRSIQELRARPFEWTQQVAINTGAQRYEFQHVAGARYFTVHDTLSDNHRYTAVLVGTLQNPELLMIDEWGDSAQGLRSVSITQHFLGAQPEATDARHAVRPNPATDVVEVHAEPGSSTLLIVDVLGRVVAEHEMNGPAARVATDHLAPGIYTLMARRGGSVVWSERLVIAR